MISEAALYAFLSANAMCTPNVSLLYKIDQIKYELVLKGWQPTVVELCRTVEQQKKKVKDGYSQTMNSKHLRGRAFDMVDVRYYWRIPQSHKFWKDFGTECRKNNLIWGGDWISFKDVAHCEMKEESK